MMNHEALIHKATKLAKLGESIKAVIAMRDACTPASDAVWGVYSRLSNFGASVLGEVNARALLSIALQSGLDQEIERRRIEMTEIAASMADGDEATDATAEDEESK